MRTLLGILAWGIVACGDAPKPIAPPSDSLLAVVDTPTTVIKPLPQQSETPMVTTTQPKPQPKPEKPIESKSLDFSGPPTWIYKTKADYSRYVPVLLSDDKTAIVGYPATQDLYVQGKLAYPTQMPNGYWLDQKGIAPNTAFLNITYEEYSKMKDIPPLSELYQRILDKDPFTALCNCGNRYQFADTKAIESLVKGGLKGCKVVK